MKYPDYCITVIRMYCEKDGHCRRQACFIEIENIVLLWRHVFSIGRLTYNRYLLLFGMLFSE